MAFVTDSNRPQPLWQPPPTACLTASGAASEAPSLLMQPCQLPRTATSLVLKRGPSVPPHPRGPVPPAPRAAGQTDADAAAAEGGGRQDRGHHD